VCVNVYELGGGTLCTPSKRVDEPNEARFISPSAPRFKARYVTVFR